MATRGVNSIRSAVHSTFFSSLARLQRDAQALYGRRPRSLRLFPSRLIIPPLCRNRPASCSHWRSHKRCTVVSAFAIEAPTRHEKMIHARKARFPHDFCTRGTCLHQKRCASLSGEVPSAENHMCSCPAECHKATLRHVCTTAAVVQLHRARRL